MTKEQEKTQNRRVDDKLDLKMKVIEGIVTSKLDKSDKARTARFDKFEQDSMAQQAKRDAKTDKILNIVEGLSSEFKDLKKRMDGNEKDGEKSLPAKVKDLEDWRTQTMAWWGGVAAVVGIVVSALYNWISSTFGK